MKSQSWLKKGKWLGLTLGFLISHPLMAAPPELTPRQYEQLSNLGEALQEERYEEVYERGYPLFERPRGNQEQRAFVRAFVARVLAQAYQQQEDLVAATEILQKSLKDAEYLDRQTLQALRWLLVQVYIGQGDYQQALARLESWWGDEEEPVADAHYLRAALLGQLELWQEAEPWLLIALDLQEEHPDSWLALAVAIYQQQEDWSGAAEYQAKRLEINPERPRLWVQLSQLQKLAGEDAEALVTQELAMRRGYLNNREMERLGRELLQSGQPLRAAKVFEVLLADQDEPEPSLLRLATQAWLQTSQPEDIAKALERLVKATQETADWRRLADWHYSQGHWEQALDAWTQLRPALEERERAQVELLMANAHIELANYSEARYLLEELLESSEERAARQWLNYLDALN
ncbi:Tetratricopeptide repeat-containing protein [Marinospirillum celere]|uniref:Tetratricopeptide repeat-containing protein n=1 Tax=Marinospirillum celere TaxID=1122252 RepID=A0A1I1IZ15_9GAMM|nr:hypothetical protein [Marinospirillum celere]SFC41101.1 Tetratricopeptide repeat-containing protein [Marinospirillum celere]